MRIYLDVCTIQRPLDNQAQLRIRIETEAILGILALCEAEKLVLLSSAAHIIETEKNPYPDRKEHALSVLGLASQYVPTSSEVAERTTSYISAGIGHLDALHLALAVEGRATYFCTTDDQLLQRGQHVNTNETSVVSPLELVSHLDQL